MACGSPTLVLPPPLVRPAPGAGSADTGRAALRDRGLGRTGLACADCHSVDGVALRPAPHLTRQTPRWAGRPRTLADAINSCAERYLARPPLSAAMLGDLIAALPVPAQRRAQGDRSPADLYRAACAHCHAKGPAPRLCGRAWPDQRLRAITRGRNRPAHPGRLMPTFQKRVLSDTELARLAQWLSHSQPADGSLSGQYEVDNVKVRHSESNNRTTRERRSKDEVPQLPRRYP